MWRKEYKDNQFDRAREREPIANRVILIMEALNLNQSKFAEGIGWYQTNISKILIEKTSVSDKLIDHICSVYNVSKSWFLYGNGSMFNPISKPPQPPSTSVIFDGNELPEDAKELLGLYEPLESKTREEVRPRKT